MSKPILNSRSAPCPLCSAQFKTVRELTEHFDNAHPDNMNTHSSHLISNVSAFHPSTDSIITWLKRTQEIVMNPLSNAIMSSSDMIKFTASSFIPIERNSNRYLLKELYKQEFLNEESCNHYVEDILTKKHWVKDQEFCSQCQKSLGLIYGKHHCRKCGRIFCDEDSNYQIRLNPSNANHDPISGLWYRCCRSCFESREGYHDHFGVTRDRSISFMKLRKKKLDTLLRESVKITKRVEKLVIAIQDGFETIRKNSPAATSISRNALRLIEKSITPWEDDASFTKCPYCSQNFSTFFVGKHHCRFCGIVLCGAETCLKNITVHDKENKISLVDVKICISCYDIVKRYQNQNIPCPSQWIAPLYNSWLEFVDQVQRLLPSFNESLYKLESKKYFTVDDPDYQKGLLNRKNLLCLFTQMEDIVKKVKDLGFRYPNLTKCCDNISVHMVQFLQTRMFSLRLLPRPSSNTTATSSSPRKIDSDEIETKFIEQKQLEELIMLQTKEKAVLEQMENLNYLIEEGIRKRKLEDVQILKENLGELLFEMEYIQKQMNSISF